MIPLSRHFKGKRRLVVILGIVGATVLVVGGYMLWSTTSWAAYHTQYQKQHGKTEGDIKAALDKPASTPKERTAKLEALVAATKDLEREKCEITALLGWQQSVNGTYKKWQKECEAEKASVEAFGNQLTIITDYLKSEHALSASLSTAVDATKSKVTEKNFSTVLAAWKTAAASIKQMEVSSEFEPVKTKAQKAVDAVARAWQALIAAHTAKNEANYEKALKGVTDAYSGIADIEKDSTGRFAPLSKTLQSRYEDAF